MVAVQHTGCDGREFRDQDRTGYPTLAWAGVESRMRGILRAIEQWAAESDDGVKRLIIAVWAAFGLFIPLSTLIAAWFTVHSISSCSDAPRDQWKVRPPSTASAIPVTNDDSAAVRNRIAAAISSGAAGRRNA